MILNYNGAELLPKCLPSIVAASKKSRYKAKVVLLDNLSTDGGLRYAAEHFPDVEIVRSPENKVLCSYNAYLATIHDPIAILLNNDIRTDESFIDPLLTPFLEDKNCFMAAPRVMSFDGNSIEAGRSKSGMRFGTYFCESRFSGYEKDALKASFTDSSGFGAVSVDKFLALGGYDEKYLPGIMEDVDLCYRAKQAGFKLYYVPDSVVYHMGQASFKKKFGASKILRLAHRNTFLFMWKNLKGMRYALCQIFGIPVKIAISLLRGRSELFLGFFDAIKLEMKAKSK